jgi:hypothetical protein
MLFESEATNQPTLTEKTTLFQKQKPRIAVNVTAKLKQDLVRHNNNVKSLPIRSFNNLQTMADSHGY